MLTTEEIKKACEFADGFEYEGETFTTLKILTPIGIIDFTDTHNNRLDALYSLFLQRVIEGINRLGVKNLTISQNNCGAYIYDNFNQETTHCYLLGYCDNSFDQAKEQAIKYILEKI